MRFIVGVLLAAVSGVLGHNVPATVLQWSDVSIGSVSSFCLSCSNANFAESAPSAIPLSSVGLLLW
jgi:hypothetical protein